MYFLMSVFLSFFLSKVSAEKAVQKANNENRVGKTLKTTLNEGELVKLNCYKNGKDEAIGISDEIEKIVKPEFKLSFLADGVAIKTN